MANLEAMDTVVLRGTAWILILTSLVIFSAYALVINEKKKWIFNTVVDTHKNRKKDNQAIRDIGFRTSFASQMEQKILFQSGLKNAIPNLTWTMVMLGCGGCGLFVALLVWFAFKIPGMIISGFILGLSLPLQSIMLWHDLTIYKLKKSLPSFYSHLLRWAQIQPDLYFCISRVGEGDIHPKLKKAFRRFIADSRAGVSSQTAFMTLNRSLEGTGIEDFLHCVERAVYNRGDIVKMLMSFETEAYRYLEETESRRLSQLGFKWMVTSLGVFTMILIYAILKENPMMSSFYLKTPVGHILLSVLAFLSALTFAGGMRYDSGHL